MFAVDRRHRASATTFGPRGEGSCLCEVKEVVAFALDFSCVVSVKGGEEVPRTAVGNNMGQGASLAECVQGFARAAAEVWVPSGFRDSRDNLCGTGQ